MDSLEILVLNYVCQVASQIKISKFLLHYSSGLPWTHHIKILALILNVSSVLFCAILPYPRPQRGRDVIPRLVENTQFHSWWVWVGFQCLNPPYVEHTNTKFQLPPVWVGFECPNLLQTEWKRTQFQSWRVWAPKSHLNWVWAGFECPKPDLCWVRKHSFLSPAGSGSQTPPKWGLGRFWVPKRPSYWKWKHSNQIITGLDTWNKWTQFWVPKPAHVGSK